MSGLKDSLMSQEITVQCPGCGADNRVTLRQCEQGARITCSGCAEQVKLNLSGGSIGDLASNIERSVKQNLSIKLHL